MIIADEEHMKKLQKGSLNFQRVAFQQRVLKGKNMNRLSKKALEKSIRRTPNNTDPSDGAEEGYSTAAEDDEDRISQDESEQCAPPLRGILSKKQTMEEDSPGRIERSSGNSLSTSKEDSQQPCCSKSLPPQTLRDLSQVTEENAGKIALPTTYLTELNNQKEVVSKEDETFSMSSGIGRKRKTSHPSTINTLNSNNSNDKLSMTPLVPVKKPKVTFRDHTSSQTTELIENMIPSRYRCGAIEEYLGTSGGFLNGRFFRLATGMSKQQQQQNGTNEENQSTSEYVSLGGDCGLGQQQHNGTSVRDSIRSRMFG